MKISELKIGMPVKFKLNYDKIYWSSDYSFNCSLRVWIYKKEIPTINYYFKIPPRDLAVFLHYKRTRYLPGDAVSYRITSVHQDIRNNIWVVKVVSNYSDIFILEIKEDENQNIYIYRATDGFTDEEK